ncbi:protein piccolo-like [Platysternon megacephalum]|uniref:Protein piccolo-like n=1 Tax=Platysternon megacephalum TaxID=55544 RepID=A0A4D9E3R9_9SAUR|nr:protein piccolo-like [Platysternon megacephalum]
MSVPVVPQPRLGTRAVPCSQHGRAWPRQSLHCGLGFVLITPGGGGGVTGEFAGALTSPPHCSNVTPGSRDQGDWPQGGYPALASCVGTRRHVLLLVQAPPPRRAPPPAAASPSAASGPLNRRCPLQGAGLGSTPDVTRRGHALPLP